MRRGVNDYFAKRDGNIGDIGRFGFAPVSSIQRDRFSGTEARMGSELLLGSTGHLSMGSR